MLDADLDRAVDLVEDLADARLLDAAGSGRDGEPRYRFHELVRLFGRERAQAEDTPAGRHAALAQALSGWLTLAEHADARLPARERPPIRGTAARWAAPGGCLRLCADPEAWFEAERANLVAAAALCEEGQLIASDLRAPFQQALALESIGKLHQAAGRPGKAAIAWRDAQRLLTRIGSVAETGQLDALPSGITSR